MRLDPPVPHGAKGGSDERVVGLAVSSGLSTDARARQGAGGRDRPTGRPPSIDRTDREAGAIHELIESSTGAGQPQAATP
jgi:hypothetical protein